MLSEFKVFDAHCDTLTVKSLFHTKTQLTPFDMHKYQKYIQVFAICADKGNAYSEYMRHIKRFDRLIKNWHLTKILTKEDLKEARFGAILALEGGDGIHTIASLKRFYNMGVRLLTLTWNNSNGISSSIMAANDKGLTDFGRKIIHECENLGILVDLSHVSVKGFFDVAEIAKKPFVCSHSNSSVVYEHKRGLSDAQFLKLIECGGVSGINFYPPFLGKNPNITHILSNIEHFCSLGGEKNIGMGSDFDGIEKMPTDCDGARYMYTIAEELFKHNYSENLVKDIMYGNFCRVFNEIL